MLVGDALMAPYELFRQGGAMSMNDRNVIPGVQWLMNLQQHFRDSVWMNPEMPNASWMVRDGKLFFHAEPVTAPGGENTGGFAPRRQGRYRHVRVRS